MNLFEAAVVADIETCPIRRRCWPEGCAVFPTNNKMACILKIPKFGIVDWHPKKEDLIATDWELPPKGEKE